RVLGGDGVDAAGFEVADELAEQPPGAGEPEAQCPAQAQVIPQRITQWRPLPAHAVSPGQGRASWRSAPTSTFNGTVRYQNCLNASARIVVGAGGPYWLVQ